MSMKVRKLREQLENIQRRLRNAEEYVARGENVESSSFLHTRDWEGRSGHPLWMKNYMIPATKRGRALKEKALDRILVKEKESKLLARRKRAQKSFVGSASDAHR